MFNEYGNPLSDYEIMSEIPDTIDYTNIEDLKEDVFECLLNGNYEFNFNHGHDSKLIDDIVYDYDGMELAIKCIIGEPDIKTIDKLIQYCEEGSCFTTIVCGYISQDTIDKYSDVAHFLTYEKYLMGCKLKLLSTFNKDSFRYHLNI